MSSQSNESHDMALLRRGSAAEAAISYKTSHADSWSSHVSSFGSSLNLSFSDVKTKIHDAFFEEEIRISKEERKHELRTALALGQRGDQRRKAKNIMMNDKEFRKLKQGMMNTGMLTHTGLAHVLSQIIEERSRCSLQVSKAESYFYSPNA
jgi:hypothetical protein